MPSHPNILFLMADQMQGRVFEPGHPCRTPHLDRLAARGVRIRNAYTPNAICSPARASLMTGRLPHNHGVLTVTHTVDDDQSCLRTEYPHWAQRLREAGYRTGYFGKWHVERSGDLARFGWRSDGENQSERFKKKSAALLGAHPPEPRYALRKENDQPPGYQPTIFYGVTDLPPEKRGMGICTALALDFLDEAMKRPEPWCCFVSVQEPHDPFICGQAAFERYDVDALELPPNVHDDLEGRPNIYRKAGRLWKDLSDREHREAAACYYASITELDGQFARLLDKLDAGGQREQTLVVLTSDHGESLGAHGLYCKNFSASEEIYTIPMILAGPGVARGAATEARVGLHDLAPTLLEYAGAAPLPCAPDARSFAALLEDPAAREKDFTKGFAEYFGGRMILTQRVVWDGPWKFVFNGFDYDELYNLDDDPFEMKNLAADPAHDKRLRRMCAELWKAVRDTNDHSLYRSNYPILRVAPYGPRILEEEGLG